MLDIKYIRENPKKVEEAIVKRGLKFDLKKFLKLDEGWRKLNTELDNLKAQRNQITDKIATAKPAEKSKLITGANKLKQDIKEQENKFTKLDTEHNALWKQIPNLVHPDSPTGGEEGSRVIQTVGTPPNFKFQPKTHEQLMRGLDLVDFERGAKVTGAKFYFSKKDLVRLNFALLQYGMEILAKHGYELIETPDLAKNNILEGIGFNPKGPETQVYSVENSDLSLIGTAEITMGGYHADEILDLSSGPKKYAALSHCFRTEAGAYGKESAGLFRVHQFTKLEMFVYCEPEDSERIHLELLAIEKEVCDGLEFPYQVVDIAAGDLGTPAYRKYDIEAWMTMKGEAGGYAEITSTSNTTDYQSRALNIKYRKPDGKTEYAHTLNGTAVVLSRFPVVIFENFQQADGSIKIPKVLRRWFDQDIIAKSKV